VVGHELVGIAEILPFWLHSGQCAGQGREHASVVRTPFRGVGSAMVQGSFDCARYFRLAKISAVLRMTGVPRPPAAGSE